MPANGEIILIGDSPAAERKSAAYRTPGRELLTPDYLEIFQ